MLTLASTAHFHMVVKNGLRDSCEDFGYVDDLMTSCFLSLSGVYFQGTTIGMAPIMSMCTAEQSGGIVMVSNICSNTFNQS